MTMPDAQHPIWSIIRTVVVMTGACVMLSITATSFDAGEMKAVGGVGAASLVFDIIKRALSSNG